MIVGNKLEQVWRLRQPMCRLCTLSQTEGLRSVCIMGRTGVLGQVPAIIPSIMLVGEAPGSVEDKMARPFVGRAGSLLQRILTLTDMIDLVYITNVCKCRPPSNRPPSDAEAKTCSENYLMYEVAIIQPKVIVALGRTAMDTLAVRRRGRLETVKWLGVEYRMIGTWHPSAAEQYATNELTNEIMGALVLAKETANEHSARNSKQ